MHESKAKMLGYVKIVYLSANNAFFYKNQITFITIETILL
jgi:hypothetical protein